MHVNSLCPVTHLSAFAMFFSNVSENSENMPCDTIYFLKKVEKMCVRVHNRHKNTKEEVGFFFTLASLSL